MKEKLITRRLFLQGAAITITVLALPGCFSADLELVKIDKNGEFFNHRELTIIADVAEIMIPRTDTPGAIDAQVAAVLDGLMITWASSQTKKWFKALITHFDALSQSEHNKPYDQISLDERRLLIQTLDENSFSQASLTYSEAYKHLKYIVFRIYYTSEEASQSHVAIPGQYNGDLSLTQYNTLMKEHAHG